MIRFTGLFAIIPATVLLTISFFVLFTLTKVENTGLKKFGKCVAVLLWIAAGLIVLGGLFILVTGHHPMIEMMKEACKNCPLHMK